MSDVERLFKALGGEVAERGGSKISLVLNGRRLFMHRPHPGNELKLYQVEDVREFLERENII